MMGYYIKKDGRFISVFIPTTTNIYNEIVGNIYNIRRKYSHKRVPISWRSITKYRVNLITIYSMRDQELLEYEYIEEGIPEGPKSL